MDERIDPGVLIATSGETSANGFDIGTSTVPVPGALKSTNHRGGRVGICKELRPYSGRWASNQGP